MLCNVFSLRENGLRKEAPKDTNGVERVNQDSKQKHSTGIVKAMEYLYKKGEAGKPGMVGTGTGTGMCDRKSHTPQAKYIIAH